MTDSPSPEKLLLSISDTCHALSIGRTTCYALMADGTLRSRTIGRRRLILAESVRALAAAHDGAEAA